MMKYFGITVLAIALLSLTPANHAEAGISFSFATGYHDALSPYGSWVSVSSYGECWRPRASAGWMPYTNGYWAYSSYGPTWYGAEPWSWAAYHYGYWIWTAQFGWVWVPGYEWHPGRVEWSYGGGYIGWRPYSPRGYGRYDGYYGGNSFNFWVFIDANRFGYDNYSRYLLPRDSVRGLFDRRVVRVKSGTFHRDELERIVHRPVRKVSVQPREIQVGKRTVRAMVTAGEELKIREHAARVEKSHVERKLDVPGKSKIEIEKSARSVEVKKPTFSNSKSFSSSRDNGPETRKIDTNSRKDGPSLRHEPEQNKDDSKKHSVSRAGDHLPGRSKIETEKSARSVEVKKPTFSNSKSFSSSRDNGPETGKIDTNSRKDEPSIRNESERSKDDSKKQSVSRKEDDRKSPDKKSSKKGEDKKTKSGKPDKH